MTGQRWIRTTVAWVVGSVSVGCGGGSSGALGGEHDAGRNGSLDSGAPRDARHDGHADAAVGPDAGGDATPEDAAAPFDARPLDALPPLPRVVNSDGGDLVKPNIVAVFFSNDDPSLLPTLEQFYTGVGASSYWRAALARTRIG